MAKNLGALAVYLTANTGGLEKGMNVAAGSIKKFAGIAMGALGVGALGMFAKECIALGDIQEANERRLSAALSRTGNAVGMNVAQLKDFASELQNVTTHGDEETLKLMETMLSFGGTVGDEFKRSMALAYDLSEVLGNGALENVKKLGKVMASPLDALTGLKEAGVVFTAQQQDSIKKLVAEGKKREAQLIILAELEARVGGAAKAAADSSAGQKTQIANIFGDIKEAIGMIVSESISMGPTLGNIKNVLADISGFLNRDLLNIAYGIDYAFDNALMSFDLLGTGFVKLGGLIGNIVGEVVNAIVAIPQLIVDGLKFINAALWDVINLVKDAGKLIWDALLGKDVDFSSLMKNFGNELKSELDKNKPVWRPFDTSFNQLDEFDKYAEDLAKKREANEKKRAADYLARLDKQHRNNAEADAKKRLAGKNKNDVVIPVQEQPALKFASAVFSGSIEAYQARLNTGKNVQEKQLEQATRTANATEKISGAVDGLQLETAEV